MIDVVAPRTRSRMMATIRGANTRPELLVRSFLHRNGLRYRLHAPDLPGRPDIVLPRWRSAVFVHGCFWHRHPGCRFATTAATSKAFWQAKFNANVARDTRQVKSLMKAGWNVSIIWECEVESKEALGRLLSRIRPLRKKGTAR